MKKIIEEYWKFIYNIKNNIIYNLVNDLFVALILVSAMFIIIATSFHFSNAFDKKINLQGKRIRINETQEGFKTNKKESKDNMEVKGDEDNKEMQKNVNVKKKKKSKRTIRKKGKMEIEVKNNQDKKQNNLDKLEIIEKKRKHQII